MPYFYEDVGFAAFFVGFIFTGLMVSRATAALVGGRAADRLGRKPVIYIGYGNYILGALIILGSVLFVSTNTAVLR